MAAVILRVAGFGKVDVYIQIIHGFKVLMKSFTSPFIMSHYPVVTNTAAPLTCTVMYIKYFEGKGISSFINLYTQFIDNYLVPG
jgi:hypothetical protein